MYKLVRQQVLCVWLALLGVLFSALAPTISHAMAAHAGSADTVQICTMGGMAGMSASMMASKTPDGKSAPGDHVFQHCPYCTTHNGPGAALPTTPFVFAPFTPSFSYPPLFYQSAVPLFSWTAAAPRGPPRLC